MLKSCPLRSATDPMVMAVGNRLSTRTPMPTPISSMPAAVALVTIALALAKSFGSPSVMTMMTLRSSRRANRSAAAYHRAPVMGVLPRAPWTKAPARRATRSPWDRRRVTCSPFPLMHGKATAEHVTPLMLSSASPSAIAASRAIR